MFELYRLVLVFFIGAIVGLRNEITHAKKGHMMLGGFRSYGITAVIVYLIARYLWALEFLSYAIITVLLSLVTIHYIHHLFIRKTKSLSMELSYIFVILIAYLLGIEVLGFKVAFTLVVLVSFLMSYNTDLKRVLFGFSEIELKEIVLFGVLVMAILPWLPNQDYSIMQGLQMLVGSVYINNPLLYTMLTIKWFNPYRFMFIVVVFSFVKLLGYILVKYLQGVKVWFIQAIVGGFISSTTTTISLAKWYKDLQNKARVKSLVLMAILVANMVSFIEVTLLVLPFSYTFAYGIFAVTIAMLLFAVIYYALIARTEKRGRVTHKMIPTEHGLDLTTGFKFATIYTLVRFLVLFLGSISGSAIALLPLILLGVTGIDIASINLAVLVAEGSISFAVGILAFIAVNTINLLAKVFYVEKVVRDSNLARSIFVMMLFLIVGSLLGAMYLLF